MMIKRLALLVALCGAPTLALADENTCTIATTGDSPVAAACKKGGRKEAEETMGGLVKTAKAAGTVFKCKQCHEDLDNYKLKKNAPDDFKKLLAAAQKK
jgi:hypothetical protein